MVLLSLCGHLFLFSRSFQLLLFERRQIKRWFATIPIAVSLLTFVSFPFLPWASLGQLELLAFYFYFSKWGRSIPALKYLTKHKIKTAKFNVVFDCVHFCCCCRFTKVEKKGSTDFHLSYIFVVRYGISWSIALLMHQLVWVEYRRMQVRWFSHHYDLLNSPPDAAIEILRFWSGRLYVLGPRGFQKNRNISFRANPEFFFLAYVVHHLVGNYFYSI